MPELNGRTELDEIESVESKIQGITAQMNQMMNMVEENTRLIAKGDDVEGRTFLKQHLLVEIANCQARIDYLNNLPSREEAVELQNDLEEAYILLYGGNE